MVLPALGRAEPPAHEDAGGVVLQGLGTSRLLRRATALVVVRAHQGELVALVKTADLACRPVQGMDPDFGLVEVTGAATAVAPVSPLPAERWSMAVTGARRAIGHELVGASAAMLELARLHALSRVQFDRPISSFQAVRHRLADSLVALESARALLDAAWQDGSGETAAMAKAWPAARPARWPATASRSSPALVSQPSIPCTATFAGCCSSTSCSARRGRSPPHSVAMCSPADASRPRSPCRYDGGMPAPRIACSASAPRGRIRDHPVSAY